MSRSACMEIRFCFYINIQGNSTITTFISITTYQQRTSEATMFHISNIKAILKGNHTHSKLKREEQQQQQGKFTCLFKKTEVSGGNITYKRPPNLMHISTLTSLNKRIPVITQHWTSISPWLRWAHNLDITFQCKH